MVSLWLTVMEKKPYVVLGEAPESDSEEEINVPVVKRVNTTHGIIVAGEAPESDEEHDEGSVSSAISVSSVTSVAEGAKAGKTTERTKKKDDAKYNTLLHRKLRERNMALHKNLCDFMHQHASNANRELNATNQQLLRCQMQLQEAATVLHTLHGNMSQLNTKMSAITSASFLSRINTQNS